MKRRYTYQMKWVVCLLAIASSGMKAQEQMPYKNPNLPVEERVQDLLQRMTLEEKVDQLNMKSLNALQMDQKGQVTDSSVVKLFQGRSKVLLWNIARWNSIPRPLISIYGHRPVWEFRLSR